MKRSIYLVLSLLVLAGGFSSCKRVESVKKQTTKTIVYKDGTVEEKSYTLTPPEKKKAQQPKKAEEAKPEKAKYLSGLKAKRLLNEQLKKAEEKRLVAPVRIGYYECNDYAERLNLIS